ncbi:DNA primase [Staphylococcus sp. HMSC056G08]|nr:DNA primase [Staphylococcus sp. HMSC056G08]
MTFVEYEKGKKHAGKNADESETSDSFEDCGIKLTDKDLVIDIDDVPKEVIHAIIQFFNIETQTVWTDRGVHFYFKKPENFKGANGISALGFPVEYKHIKNTKSVTVKRNGVLRQIDNEGVRENLPEIFQVNRKIKNNLLGMGESDGRNDALYKHKMAVYSLKDTVKILNFINEFVFAEKLPNDEISTIARDEAIDTKDMSFDTIAKSLVNQYYVRFYNNVLFFRDDEGKFINDENMLKRKIHQFLDQKDSRNVEEVYKQLLLMAPIITLDDDESFEIHFNNGYLHEGNFYEMESKTFTPYHIDIDYHYDAEAVKVVDDYLNHLSNNDEEYKKLILEVLAHTLVINKEFKRMLAKFFIFVGDGGNGKGTLLTIIRAILNRKNCSGLSIGDMADERYFVTMQGKLANLGDDIQDEPINNKQMKALKNISTCDFVSTRQLFQQATEVEMTLSLIFTSNHILKSWEKGDSYKRRVMWLPIYTKPAKKEKNFIQKLTTQKALEYWIRLIIEAYKRLYKNERFTTSKVVEQFNDQYHEENNNFLLYLQDFERNDFLHMKPKQIYDEYEAWAEENDLNAQSKKQVKDTIEKNYGLVVKGKKINGTTQRVYVEIDKNDEEVQS